MPLNPLVRQLTLSNSRDEDVKVARKEAEHVELQLSKYQSSAKTTDYLVRLLFCNMVDPELHLDPLHFIKLATSGRNLYERRVAMTGAVLSLSPEDDIGLMLVNTLRKGLEGTPAEAAMSLYGIVNLMNQNLIPAIKGSLLILLSSSSATVRKKAVLAMGRMVEVDPSSIDVSILQSRVETALGDADLGVISAALNLIEAHFDKFQSLEVLVPRLEGLLDNVLQSGRHDYHGTPAPWLQVRLLRILRRLNASSLIFQKAFDIARDGADGSFSIILEALRYQRFKEEYQDQIQEILQTFLRAMNHNLKYLGLCCLEALQQWDDVVEECAMSKDSALQCKALDVMALAKPQELYKILRDADPITIFEILCRIDDKEFVSDQLVNLIDFNPPNSIESRILRLASSLDDVIIRKLLNRQLTSLSLHILSRASDDSLQSMHSSILLSIGASFNIENVDIAIRVMLQLVSRMGKVDSVVIEMVEEKAATSTGHISERCRQFVRTVKDMELLRRIVSIDILEGLDAYWKRDEHVVASPTSAPLHYDTRPRSEAHLTPNRITTDQFASQWTLIHHQESGSIRTKDIEDFLLSRSLAIVERIGDEILVSGIGHDAVYGHFRKIEDTWNYTFKCSDSSDANTIASLIR